MNNFDLRLVPSLLKQMTRKRYLRSILQLPNDYMLLLLFRMMFFISMCNQIYFIIIKYNGNVLGTLDPLVITNLRPNIAIGIEIAPITKKLVQNSALT